MRRITAVVGLWMVLILFLTACGPKVTPVAENEPYLLIGSFDYTNSIITDYYVEHAVAMVDMYGFVTRDEEWEIPVASQTLGFLALDAAAMHGEYTLQLPARPTGMLVDVDNNGRTETGVQVFAVSYWPNLYGGPYSEGDDPARGWPTYLASVLCDAENDDEVVGGKLVVWAPDAEQAFPSGYGDDGLLFTADDPTATIPAGWTIVDLDQSPFAFIKEAQPSLGLYEPQDVAIKDYSNLPYVDAFDAMFNFARTNYAFNGIEGKEPDWEALFAEIRPRIIEAQTSGDVEAFYLALRDFTWAFKDGHVSLDGGDVQNRVFSQDISGGYGFAIRELDDGRFLVIFVLEDGPAAEAGMQVGAVVTEFNGTPISEALESVHPWSLPHSTDWALRYQQARYLLCALPGTQARVTFANPGGQPQTVTLEAVTERESFSFTSVYADAPTDTLLPVNYNIMDSGVGYIRINSNYDDLNLIIKLFERALKTFEQVSVPGIIIDLRYNSGGASLGLAGFLTDQEIPMGQLEYYSEASEQFEPEGTRDRVLPNVEQYRFDKIVLLVGQACFSACELEAYGFSQVPGAIVVGMYPTGGVEAEVARGQILMPEGFSMQFPTGRFTNPDGSLFLEGTGVQPTLRVPITEETVLMDGDVVLLVGEQAVLRPEGAGITPSGPPRMVTDPDVANSLLSERGTRYLEEWSREGFTGLEAQGTVTYTVQIHTTSNAIWAYGWCATTQEILEQNFANIRFQFELDGEAIAIETLFEYSGESNGLYCRQYLTVLTEWPVGEHHLVVTVTFLTEINDGMDTYPAGDYIYEYDVYVGP